MPVQRGQIHAELSRLRFSRAVTRPRIGHHRIGSPDGNRRPSPRFYVLACTHVDHLPTPAEPAFSPRRTASPELDRTPHAKPISVGAGQPIPATVGSGSYRELSAFN